MNQAKRRVTAFQVECREALPLLRELQATQSRRQRLGGARAGVSAIGERAAGARDSKVWGTRPRSLAREA